MAGYEVTFPNFCQLLCYGPYRKTIAPLLEDMFRYKLVGEGDATVVTDASGAVIDLKELHQRIQNGPAKQLQFYNAAMSLWR
jgi:hypothetical protein